MRHVGGTRPGGGFYFLLLYFICLPVAGFPLVCHNLRVVCSIYLFIYLFIIHTAYNPQVMAN